MKAKEFFDTLEARVDASRTAGISQSYLFDIAGEGQWLVDVRDGSVKVTAGEQPADVVIRTSGETFEKIASGSQNPATAYMTGKLKLEGDLAAAMKLQKFF